MTHHTEDIEDTDHIGASDDPVSLRSVTVLAARVRAVETATKKSEDAHTEAERLWKESIVAAAQEATPQDRLAAFEKARDVAFCLWCDLAKVEGSASSDDLSTS